MLDDGTTSRMAWWRWKCPKSTCTGRLWSRGS